MLRLLARFPQPKTPLCLPLALSLHRILPVRPCDVEPMAIRSNVLSR